MTTINPTLVEVPIEARNLDGYALPHYEIKLVVDGPINVDSKIIEKGIKIMHTNREKEREKKRKVYYFFT